MSQRTNEKDERNGESESAATTTGVRATVLVLALALALGAVACREDLETKAAMVTGGDPKVGRDELRAHGCAACHTIPGVPGATALAGPPLDHMASRAYVAGMLPNTPENLQRWIMHPQEVKPKNAMPEVPMTDASARHMTAYLYTLR